MSLYVTVRDKKRNIIRQITRSAYSHMTNRYELIEGEPAVQQKKNQVKEVVEPVVEVTETRNEIIATPKKRSPKPKTA